MNNLYFGDNLDVMRRHIADDSVDLVYLDPPFNSNATYNVLFAEQDGSRAEAQIEAFGDTWRWDQGAVAAYEEVVERGGPSARAMLAFRTLLGDNDMIAYLSMMAPRLIEIHRVLKPSGSVYLHCDSTANHYLKILMDSIFGPRNFLNNIVWLYGLGGSSKRYWPRKHDDILWYSKERDGHFFEADMVPATSQRMKGQMKKAPDYWDIPTINNMAKERLGYPTQKPEELLERIVRSSCPKGGVVLDPFCGCGTAVVVAERLDRKWVGIDITHLAINLMKHRLQDSFGEDVNKAYKVVGEPVSLSGARELAKHDPYQFEWWALGLVGARPAEGKKGGDRGIDGRLYFHDEPTGGKTKQVILSVKSGKTGPDHVRDLRGVVEREEAQIGVLITLQRPTRQMRAEAASAASYSSPWGRHPKLQVLTVEDLLHGQRIDMPPAGASVTYKKAPRSVRPAAEQDDLFDE
jgi:site-specific DNA-methyltransferase (adenine-specific)